LRLVLNYDNIAGGGQVLSSFVIVLREGFEAFLIVAIVLAYLRKSHRTHLVPAVHWAIGASLAVSAGLGWVLYQGANVPLWEGVTGLVAIPFVVGLVIHMWRAGPTLKQKMEDRLETTATSKAGGWAAVGVFAFTALMVTREGMETALMLFQVRSVQVVQGAFLGLAGAGLMAWAWARYGHRINIRRFFQVTGIFLLLFVVQRHLDERGGSALPHGHRALLALWDLREMVPAADGGCAGDLATTRLRGRAAERRRGEDSRFGALG
jgi:high-affinity iron transporter